MRRSHSIVVAVTVSLLLVTTVGVRQSDGALAAAPVLGWVGSSTPLSESWLPAQIPPSSAVGGVLSPVIDGESDVFDVFGFGPPLHDIDTVNLTVDAVNLYGFISFHTTIAAPSSGSFDAVFGALELDSDQDTATGTPTIQNQFSPPLPLVNLGVDLIVDLAGEFFHPGEIDIIDTAGMSIVATVPVTYGDTSIQFAVPLADLGDDGIVDFTCVFGSAAQPTDAMDVVGISVSEGDMFFRGDCNGSATITLTDAILHLNAVAQMPVIIPCEDACDTNDDGLFTIADAILTLNFIYLNGLPPAAPYPFCGNDPTADDLGCEDYPACTK